MSILVLSCLLDPDGNVHSLYGTPLKRHEPPAVGRRRLAGR